MSDALETIDRGRFHAKNILFVGVDWERKGGPVLLEAFRSLRETHPDAVLTIVGCAPPIHQAGVHVVGRVPLTDVPGYYRTASIFCLPTLNEPFGLVFLEAFSYGLPIVATRIGAIGEIVQDGESGYLVAPQNADELADRLKRLLDDPSLCERFGSRGRDWVGRRYSWDATGGRIAAHIERVAKLTARSAIAPTASPPPAPEMLRGPPLAVNPERIADMNANPILRQQLVKFEVDDIAGLREHYEQHGYVVLRALIEHSLIDRFLIEYERIKRSRTFIYNSQSIHRAIRPQLNEYGFIRESIADPSTSRTVPASSPTRSRNASITVQSPMH